MNAAIKKAVEIVVNLLVEQQYEVLESLTRGDRLLHRGHWTRPSRTPPGLGRSC